MTILNDQIVFDANDLKSFSQGLQDDLTFRAGPQTTSHEYLSARVNAILEEATNLNNKDRLDNVADVSIVFAKADKATQDAIKLLLNIV